jgi:hypothetical protein
MDVWQMVRADHANIEELCHEVLRAGGHGPNSRAELFADLEDELELHIEAKETVIYPALTHDDRTKTYLGELEQEHNEIRRRMDALSARPDKDSHDWALDFKELASTIRHAFTLEENGVLIVARGAIAPQQAESMRRAYEREKIAYYESSRWHLPQTMMPSRYGLPTGMVFGVLAGVAAVGGAVLAWRMSQHGQSGSRHSAPLRPARRRPEPPFPLDSGVIDDRLSRGGMAGRTASGRGFSPNDEGMPRTAATSARDADSSDESWFSSANPPRAPSGISTPLQPGGLTPDGGPAASVGSTGTGGAQTEGRDTGSLKRDGQ